MRWLWSNKATWALWIGVAVVAISISLYVVVDPGSRNPKRTVVTGSPGGAKDVAPAATDAPVTVTTGGSVAAGPAVSAPPSAKPKPGPSVSPAHPAGTSIAPAPGAGPPSTVPGVGPGGKTPGSGAGPPSTIPPSEQPAPVQIPEPSAPPIPPGQSSFSTEVVLGGVIGPTTASGFVTLTVQCPAGTVPTGGGVKTTPPPDSLQPSPLHVIGTYPSGPDGLPVADGQPFSNWTVIVEEGAPVQTVTETTTTQAFAICGGGHGTESAIAKVSTVQGPFGASGYATATATCPAATLLLGGGANTVPGNQSTPGQQPSPLHLVGSFPSDPAGNPVSSGPSSPSWTASAEEGMDTSLFSPPIPNTTSAFAICASGDGLRASGVVAVTKAGPTQASQYVSATATCPAGTVLLGGGAYADAPPGTGQPSPLHLDGDYPTDGNGTTPTSPGPQDSWGVVSETGNGFPGATTGVFAMCGD